MLQIQKFPTYIFISSSDRFRAAKRTASPQLRFEDRAFKIVKSGDYYWLSLLNLAPNSRVQKVLMQPKRMQLVSSKDKLLFKGVGSDEAGNSYLPHGLELRIKDGQLTGLSQWLFDTEVELRSELCLREENLLPQLFSTRPLSSLPKNLAEDMRALIMRFIADRKQKKEPLYIQDVVSLVANYIVVLLGKEKARTKELSLLQLEPTLEKVLHIFGQLIPDSKKTEKVEQLQEELYMGLQQAQAMEKAMAYLEKMAP